MARNLPDGAHWSLDHIIRFGQELVYATVPVLITGEGGFVARRAVQDYEDYPEGISKQHLRQRFMRFDSDGELTRDSLHVFRYETWGANVSDGVPGFIYVPFSREMLMDTGPGNRLYMMWNESAEVAVYDERINLVDSLAIPLRPHPVSNEELREVMDEPFMTEDVRGMISDTHPVVESMVVDSEGRLWLETHDQPQYLVADAEGRPIGSFDLPEGYALKQVAYNRAYVIAETGRGWQVIEYAYELPE